MDWLISFNPSQLNHIFLSHQELNKCKGCQCKGLSKCSCDVASRMPYDELADAYRFLLRRDDAHVDFEDELKSILKTNCQDDFSLETIKALMAEKQNLVSEKQALMQLADKLRKEKDEAITIYSSSQLDVELERSQAQKRIRELELQLALERGNASRLQKAADDREVMAKILSAVENENVTLKLSLGRLGCIDFQQLNVDLDENTKLKALADSLNKEVLRLQNELQEYNKEHVEILAKDDEVMKKQHEENKALARQVAELTEELQKKDKVFANERNSLTTSMNNIKEDFQKKIQNLQELYHQVNESLRLRSLELHNLEQQYRGLQSAYEKGVHQFQGQNAVFESLMHQLHLHLPVILNEEWRGSLTPSQVISTLQSHAALLNENLPTLLPARKRVGLGLGHAHKRKAELVIDVDVEPETQATVAEGLPVDP